MTRLKTLPLIAALAALMLAAPTVRAEPYVLDKSHAQVMFSANHLGFSTVNGLFREFDAQIDFNPERVEETRVRFSVNLASVDTLWPARDNDLRGPNFFNVANYPEMIFESIAVQPTGSDSARLTGNLSLRGVTREVDFEAKLNKIGPSPFAPGRTVAGFQVTGEIDRRDFGMNFAAPAVGAIVSVRLDLEIISVQ